MHHLLLARIKPHWLWLFVNGVGLVLAGRTAWMVIAAPQVTGWVLFTNSAALRNVVLFSGKSGLILLVLSLACTPIARVLGWKTALQVRKALGLWGFCFACFHSLFFLQGKQLFIGMNMGPELWQALLDMIGIVRYGSKVPYAEAGVYALLLLIPLALTSNRLAMRRLGKNWKRLHRLVYLAAPMAIYHYWWRTITEFPAPPAPGYWQPILFAVVVSLLLIVRIPFVRHWLAGVRRPGLNGVSRKQHDPAKARSVQAMRKVTVISVWDEQYNDTNSVAPLREMIDSPIEAIPLPDSIQTQGGKDEAL